MSGPRPDPVPIRQLLAWYRTHRRTLPWRAPAGRAPDPYHVLVSELMLQQTTVATVRQRFPAFLQSFPTLAELAAAGEEDVLHAWQGLGYYRRARALHACARAAIVRHNGRLPADEADLLALPGIGLYTARAVLAIAFGRPVVPVDGNVQRVLARLHRVETPLPKAARELRALAEALDPGADPGDVAQALMDLGAMVCRPKQPACALCPWQAACAAHAAGVASDLPRRTPRRTRPVRRGVAFLLSRADGALLFRRRPAEGLLGGLHELPSSSWLEGPLDLEAALREAPAGAEWRVHERPVRHVFTHFELELLPADARTLRPPDGLWRQPREFHELALPTLIKKLLREAGYPSGDRPPAPGHGSSGAAQDGLPL